MIDLTVLLYKALNVPDQLPGLVEEALICIGRALLVEEK